MQAEYSLTELADRPPSSWHGGWVIAPEHEAQLRLTRPPLGETYLQLANLDTASSEAVIRFANQHGILEPPLEQLREFLPVPDQDRQELMSGWWQAASRTSTHSWLDGDSILVLGEALDCFHFGADLLADAVSARRVIAGQMTSSAVQWRLPYTTQRIRSATDAGAFLARLITDGLPELSPRVALEESHQPDEKPPARGIPVAAGHATLTPQPLFVVCLAELFNHLVERAHYTRCHNEPCGRQFVRQEGRAQFDQHRRTGTMYCSVACANAQHQRDHRRRKAANKARSSK